MDQQPITSRNKHRQVPANRKTKGGKQIKFPGHQQRMNNASFSHKPAQTTTAQKPRPRTATPETADSTAQEETPHQEAQQTLNAKDRGLQRNFSHYELQQQASRSAQGCGTSGGLKRN
ncbi:Hypothetical predicted protein [Pelobates cultripes]|uniref:Uncharacterized protein n=1 Tax=Pelobates cultripes TaxID=61616 RepID=A0AAD1VQ73_PELCU|nr:Hypothetical predicted protein [Pelobates cultripes]